MANNNDDLNQPYQQDDPDQWQAQQPESSGQDLSAPSGAPYGLAGQGQMGDAMGRDVDPNLAGQMDQDPNQQGNVGQPSQRQGDWNDQGMMAGGYGGNQPDLDQADQPDITPAQGAPMQPNAPTGQPPMDDLENAPDQDYP